MTGAEVRRLRPAGDDRAAFETAYLTHAPAVLGYLTRRVTDPADAADLLAEVFLVAWRRRADLPEDDGVRPWLYVVARNLLTDHHRRGTRRSRLTATLAASVTRAVEHSAEQRALDGEGEDLRAALARLDADDRELLTLVALEELTPAQAAQVLGIRPGAARSRLHRARARLRVELGR